MIRCAAGIGAVCQPSSSDEDVSDERPFYEALPFAQFGSFIGSEGEAVPKRALENLMFSVGARADAIVQYSSGPAGAKLLTVHSDFNRVRLLMRQQTESEDRKGQEELRSLFKACLAHFVRLLRKGICVTVILEGETRRLAKCCLDAELSHLQIVLPDIEPTLPLRSITAITAKGEGQEAKALVLRLEDGSTMTLALQSAMAREFFQTCLKALVKATGRISSKENSSEVREGTGSTLSLSSRRDPQVDLGAGTGLFSDPQSDPVTHPEEQDLQVPEEVQPFGKDPSATAPFSGPAAKASEAAWFEPFDSSRKPVKNHMPVTARLMAQRSMETRASPSGAGWSQHSPAGRQGESHQQAMRPGQAEGRQGADVKPAPREREAGTGAESELNSLSREGTGSETVQSQVRALVREGTGTFSSTSSQRTSSSLAAFPGRMAAFAKTLLPGGKPASREGMAAPIAREDSSGSYAAEGAQATEQVILSERASSAGTVESTASTKSRNSFTSFMRKLLPARESSELPTLREETTEGLAEAGGLVPPSRDTSGSQSGSLSPSRRTRPLPSSGEGTLREATTSSHPSVVSSPATVAASHVSPMGQSTAPASPPPGSVAEPRAPTPAPRLTLEEMSAEIEEALQRIRAGAQEQAPSPSTMSTSI